MKCLTCWEEIEEKTKICPHCGSDQELAKEFLTLAILERLPEEGEKGKIVTLLKKLGAKIEDKKRVYEEKIQPPAPSSTQPYYQPMRPTWLELPQQNTIRESSIEQPLEPTLQPIMTDSVDTIQCPQCKKEVPNKRFCKYCGAQLNIECPKCGKLNRIDSNFCKNCGTKLRE